MELLALLNAGKPWAVGLAGIAVIGGGAIATLNAIEDSEVPAPEVSTVEEVEVPVLESPEGTSTKEVNEEKEEKEEAPTTVAETSKQYNNGATGHIAAPGHSTPEPAKDPVKYVNPKNGAVNRKYLTQNEFEAAYVGYCPQDVPEGEYPNKLRPGATLGILGSAYGSKDPLAYADEIWSQMKENPNRGFTDGTIWLHATQLFDTLLGSDGVDHWEYKLGFTIDWSTLTIDWARKYPEGIYQGKYGIGTDSDAYIKMEAAAKQMTTRIRQRNAEFNAKCGY